MDNLQIYERVRNVPESAKKAFNNGRFKGTDINPMWRIKTLTEQFGPCGFGWYTEVLSARAEQIDQDTTIAIVDLNLIVKMDGEWSKPIFGTGGNVLKSKTKNGVNVSDEGYKMAYTDALSVACKHLGVGADVYWDKDRTKYTDHHTEEEETADGVACDRCGELITGVSTKTQTFTAAQIVGKSKIAFNGCYCFKCMKELQERGGN